MPRAITLGISGSIASGKSVRCEYLLHHLARPVFPGGVCMVNADKLAHACYLPGTEVYKKILKVFGNVTVGGSESNADLIDRRKLGEIVFSDQSKLQELNSIVWPALVARAGEICKRFCEGPLELPPAERSAVVAYSSPAEECGDKLLILEAAVLIEAGVAHLCDEIWLIGCSTETAIARVIQRDGLDKEKAIKRVSAQNSIEKRADILKNDNSFKGSVVQIDTTNCSSVEEGLRELDQIFSVFLERCKKIKGHS